jgi:hypothetical protein
VRLYSQQYRYDKLNQQKLFQSFLSKKVHYKNTQVTLLSYSHNTSLVRFEDGKIKTVNSQELSVDTIPNSFILKPSLVWNVDVKHTQHATIKLDYLIKRVEWQSNYVIELQKNKLKLSGWLTINNKSGKSFTNTQLKLLAGKINQAKPRNHYPVRTLKATMQSDSMAEVSTQPTHGYHLYSVPFLVNLANNEKTQIKFFQQNGIDFQWHYTAKMASPLYLRGEVTQDVLQSLKIEKLKRALPKGVVRTYAKTQNTQLLLGETQIKHTPKNTPLELFLGTNFDLKVTQTLQTRKDTKTRYNVDVRYTITNNSKEAKKVDLLIPFNKRTDSKIITQRPYRYTKGNLATFSVEVGAYSSVSFNINFQSKR